MLARFPVPIWRNFLQADFWGFQLSDHRLFAWRNFRFPYIQTSSGCAVQCDSSMRIVHGGRALREWWVAQNGVSQFLRCDNRASVVWEIGDECGVHELL